MTRDMFLRVVVRALRQTAGMPPEVQADAIAAKMDEIAELIGDSPVQAPSTPEAQQPPARMAFPSPNPGALAPAEDTTGFACTGLETDRYAPSGVAAPGQHQGPPLIIPATTIPDRDQIERVQPANPEPVRSLRPTGKMKVEELSRLIQERTPARVTVEVPMEDETKRRVVLVRDVISMHNFGSVKIVLYPQGAQGTARELSEVQAEVNVEDLPVDVSAIMTRLSAQAIDTLRPKGAVRELPVRGFTGAVGSNATHHEGQPAAAPMAAVGTNESVFGSSAASRPAGYGPPDLPSQYHRIEIPPEARRSHHE